MAVYLVGLWLERKNLKEYVSEAKHVDNLCYFRELFKLDLDDYRERSENGELINRDEVVDVIEDITVIDRAIGYLPSKVKEYENRFNIERIERLYKIPEYRIPKQRIKWNYRPGRCNY